MKQNLRYLVCMYCGDDFFLRKDERLKCPVCGRRKKKYFKYMSKGGAWLWVV